MCGSRGNSGLSRKQRADERTEKVRIMTDAGDRIRAALVTGGTGGMGRAG
jgi:hypothetical protein